MKRGHDYKGLWINFEASDGGGKSTQQKLLTDYLKNNGFYVESGREPGTTPSGEKIRKIIQDPDLPPIDPKTEMLLFVAAGIEFFENKVKPVLKEGGIYLSDRWRYSTKAYQGYGLGIDLNIINNLIDFSCSGTYPDITFLLDVNPEIGLEKLTGEEYSGRPDRIESRNKEYHERVNEGYRKIAREEPERFKIIPYIENDPKTMQNLIRKHTDSFIEKYCLEEILKRS